MEAGRSDEFIAFAQRLLDNGAFISDVSARCQRKFKMPCSRDAIHGLIQRGKLKDHKPRTTEHDATIVSMHKAGFGRRHISSALGIKHAIVAEVCDLTFGKIERTVAPKFNNKVDDQTAAMMADDPIMDIGFELFDLRANQCHWPVARWPEDYPKQRFCGEQRLMRGPHFASMYCCEHYQTSIRPRVEALQAAE